MKNQRLFKLCGAVQIVTMLIFLIIMMGVIISSKGQAVDASSIQAKIIIVDVAITAITYIITSTFMYKYRIWVSDEVDRLIEQRDRLLKNCKYL